MDDKVIELQDNGEGSDVAAW